MNLTRYTKGVVALAMAAVSIVACNVETFEDGVARFNAGNPTVPPPPPPPPPPVMPVFSDIQAQVFTPTCASSSCHGGGAPAANLNLTVGNSYAQLIGIASTEDANILRVVPGDPVNSYLMQVLDGTAASGTVMPPSGMLPQTTLDAIRTWITNGAIDDTAPPPAAPVQVTSLMPAPNSTNDPATVPNIIASFSRELVAASVNDMTFILEASVDGIFGNGNDVAIAAGPGDVALNPMNPSSAVFDLTGVTLADDLYRVRLLGNGINVIQDLDSNALDGEFGGVFPSGNTIAGGDFVALFTIETPVVIGPTLDQIQAVVFTPTCATVGCHTGAGAAGGLNLSDADTSFLELVGVASTANAAILRVAPNDPDNSYLIQKLEGTALPIMPPPPRQPLPAGDIQEIRNWILGGALRN